MPLFEPGELARMAHEQGDMTLNERDAAEKRMLDKTIPVVEIFGPTIQGEGRRPLDRIEPGTAITLLGHKFAEVTGKLVDYAAGVRELTLQMTMTAEGVAFFRRYLARREPWTGRAARRPRRRKHPVVRRRRP